MKAYQIVVIDDGSTDGTEDAIRNLYPNVILLKGDGNLWWTGAVKLGMEYAVQRGAEYIIWLNDDVLPKPNALSSLIEFLRDHPNAVVAPTCLDESNNTAIANGCIGRTPIIPNSKEIVAVHSVSGYCVAFPSQICKTIGYPDTRRYPHYGGDDMYTLKAYRIGLTVYLSGISTVILLNYKSSIDKHQLLKYTDYPFKKMINFTFFQIKSPFYLPSQYYYLTQKYNKFIGSFLFLVKLVGWLLYLLTYLFLTQSHHESSTTIKNRPSS